MTEAVPPDPISEESDVGWGDDPADAPDRGDDGSREVDVDAEDSDLGWVDDERPPHYDRD